MSLLGLERGSPDEEAEVAWRSVLVVAVLVIVGQLLFTAVTMPLFGFTDVTIARLAHAGLGFLVLVAILVRRSAPKGSLVAAFYVLALPLVPFLWMRDAELAASGLPFAPFVAHKLAIIGLAVVVPGPPLLGIGLIAVFVAIAVLEWVVLDLGTLQGLPVLEPWVTVIYGLVAMGIVAYRGHHRVVARRYAKVTAEATAFAELARFLLAIRDMSSTPLQNLEIDTALLERNHPPTPAAVRRMRNAVKQLREMRAFLAQYDHLATWGRGRESLDPEELQSWLEQLEPLDIRRGLPRERGRANTGPGG